MSNKPSLSFSNTISPQHIHHDPTIPIANFTATGRPFAPSTSKHGSAMTSLSSADGMGVGPADLLPRRYTDASLITIPVLPPFTDVSTHPDSNPVKHDTQSRRQMFKFWKPQQSSSTSSSQTRSRNQKSLAFVMRQVTRAEYLRHYAKDDDGRYIGTEEPAGDCILRHEGDLGRWRGVGSGSVVGIVHWKNEL